VRERFACRACETISQSPAPFHVTPRGLFGASLLAMILFEKFGQHQPLNRQPDRYAHEGVDLSLSTLADQVGACAVALTPLYTLIEAHVLAAGRLHGDDTTVPVLAKVGTDIGRIWTHVRDDRPFGGPAPPAALFHYSRDRRGEHPRAHPSGYTGILQADADAGYNALFKPGRAPGAITRALCWAHARRKFFILADVATQVKRKPNLAPVVSPLALEAVTRIDRIFDIERGINGKAAAVCRAPGACHPRRRRARALAAHPVRDARPSQPGRRRDRLYAQGLGRIHPVPHRWTDLPDQQRR